MSAGNEGDPLSLKQIQSLTGQAKLALCARACLRCSDILHRHRFYISNRVRVSTAILLANSGLMALDILTRSSRNLDRSDYRLLADFGERANKLELPYDTREVRMVSAAVLCVGASDLASAAFLQRDSERCSILTHRVLTRASGFSVLSADDSRMPFNNEIRSLYRSLGQITGTPETRDRLDKQLFNLVTEEIQPNLLRLLFAEARVLPFAFHNWHWAFDFRDFRFSGRVPARIHYTLNSDLLKFIESQLRYTPFVAEMSREISYPSVGSEKQWSPFDPLLNAAIRVRDGVTKVLGDVTDVLGSPFREQTSGPSKIAAEKNLHIVNTGFALQSKPERTLDCHRPLRNAKRYWFWLEVGPLLSESIEQEPQPLPVEHLPAKAKLTVVLFGFPGQIKIDPRASVGEIQLRADGTAGVIRQPLASLKIEGDLLSRRLFFPVRTPIWSGTHQLRCSIYHEGVLVQSRVITATVRFFRVQQKTGKKQQPQLDSAVDYTLSRSLNSTRLQALGHHQLSVMLNGSNSGNGSHQFRFFGAGGFVENVNLSSSELEGLIEFARGALRQVAWGTKDEWSNGRPNLYEDIRSPEGFEADLVTLARSGYKVYDQLISKLPGGKKSEDELVKLMLTPRKVQVATRSARDLVPLSMIYDYPLDSNRRILKLCPAVRDAIKSKRPLSELDCFRGACPSYNDLGIVCPGGFWGFRHEIGFPISLLATEEKPPTEEKSPAEENDIQIEEIATVVGGNGTPPTLAVAVSTDPQFTMRAAHEAQLKTRHPLVKWKRAAARDATLDLMRAGGFHIMYFYCHGGIVDRVPYILVGAPGSEGITVDNLRAYQVCWKPLRPLVFINGCRTTAVLPSVAFDLVGRFINRSNAAGVIGTEITIFEPLACEFAESFFQSFISDKKQLGAAIKEARLALLDKRNPLGLVYVPFALATLSLESLQTTPAGAKV